MELASTMQGVLSVLFEINFHLHGFRPVQATRPNQNMEPYNKIPVCLACDAGMISHFFRDLHAPDVCFCRWTEAELRSEYLSLPSGIVPGCTETSHCRVDRGQICTNNICMFQGRPVDFESERMGVGDKRPLRQTGVGFVHCLPNRYRERRCSNSCLVCN